MMQYALSLLVWIRINKAALLEATKEHPSVPLQVLWDFERRFRGAVQLLRNPYGKAKPYGFSYAVESSVVKVLSVLFEHRVVLQQSALSPLFELKGPAAVEFQKFYNSIIRDRFFELARTRQNAYATTSAAPYGWVRIQLFNGLAVAEHTSSLSYVATKQLEGTLKEQLQVLAAGWGNARESYLAIVENEKNWPSEAQSTEAECRRTEVIAQRLLRSLSVEEKALVRKHLDRFKIQLNSHLEGRF